MMRPTSTSRNSNTGWVHYVIYNSQSHIGLKSQWSQSQVMV